MSSFKQKLKDKYTIRGLIYSLLGLAGVTYELSFHHPPELLVLLFYCVIIGIGFISIFLFKEQA